MELPSASSPNLVLAHPTEEEQLQTLTHNHPWWGPSYTLEAYLDRERRLLDAPLARDGGITQWILTTADHASSTGGRPVLASCETLRKRALVRDPDHADGSVRTVWAHGVASVFTYPEMRRRGYANRLMTMLGDHLAAQEAAQPGDAVFSVLFSDIGKTFYSQLGWAPHESTHLAIPVKPASSSAADLPPLQHSSAVRPILDADLETLARRDEELLRQRLSRPCSTDPTKTRVAVLPDLETLQWHFAREALMADHLFSETPRVRGAIWTHPENPGVRVWAYWVRNQGGGIENTSKNVVEFLRLVVEGEEALSDAALGDAMGAIVGMAQAEAAQWKCTTLKLWNPDERVKRAVLGMCHLDAQLIERENDSITSLRWLGAKPVAGIDWVANEKFEWC